MSTRGFAVGVFIAACLCGTAAAQNAPAGSQPENGDQPQTMPQDVPPQFLAPQGEPSQKAPAPAVPAQGAQPPSTDDAVNAMIGAWEFSNADHDRICHFNFRGDVVPNGYRLDIDKNCPNLFPSTKDMVAWSVDNYGGLRLLDSGGNAVVELSEVEGGMYYGFTPEEGRYILQTAAAAPTRTADDMVGDWAVSRGAGKPICTLTLANSPAGDALALKVKPGCDPLVTRFAPSAWRMEEGALVLLSARGQTWQFEENDANSWQRVPETADQITLVRQ
jgi:hypothetical protein